MKKTTTTNKLALTQTTIAILAQHDLVAVAGGARTKLGCPTLGNQTCDNSGCGCTPSVNICPSYAC